MPAPFLAEVDWLRPWLAPLRATAAPIVQAPDWRAALNACAVEMGLHNHRGLPVRFVPQASLPSGTPYESFISETGGVPTRENLHDFFNALVWLTFPQIKVRLNALQAVAIADAAVRVGEAKTSGAGRGNLRDAATLFDENAALMVVRDDALIAALRSHHWREVFINRRDAFGAECEVWLFGHALMEKLVRPYKAITAHAMPIIVDPDFFGLTPPERRARLDRDMAGRLSGGLVTSDFSPLPVLGLPGWWEGQDEDFYSDTDVFRLQRRTASSST